MRQSCHRLVLMPKPRMAAAVMATEQAVSLPAPRRRMSGAVARLEMMVQAVMIIVMALWAATGAPRSAYMTGQAEPRSESGRPSETKAM